MPLDRYPLPGVEGRTDRLAQDDVRNDPQPDLSYDDSGEQSGTSFPD
jgi:hypothetical protein